MFPYRKNWRAEKTHLIFSYFDSNTIGYRPNHALKCRITVKKIDSTNTCTIALSGAPVLIGVTSINVACISWRDFDVNGKLFIFKNVDVIGKLSIFQDVDLMKIWHSYRK